MLRPKISRFRPIHREAESLSFSLYSIDEIRSLSVVKIITPISFNALGHPLSGGLYDPIMGPYESKGMCSTCQQGHFHCPGHFGHIELPLPVINPLFNKILLQIFRISCLACHTSILPAVIKNLAITQLELLKMGLLKEAQEAELLLADVLGENEDKAKRSKLREDSVQMRQKFEDYRKACLKKNKSSKVSKGSLSDLTQSGMTIRRSITKKVISHAKMKSKCYSCGTICKKMMLFESKIVYTLGTSSVKKKRNISNLVDDDEEMDSEETNIQKYLTPLEARDHLRKIWENEGDLLRNLFPVLDDPSKTYPTDLIFVEYLIVPPPKNRPAQMINNQMLEHPHNIGLRQVTSSSIMMLYCLQTIKFGETENSTEINRALKSVKGASYTDKLETIWKELQIDVDHIMDRDSGVEGDSSKLGALMGLKQIIEKKEGLFRMHMMGKRVNFAARTVITPDPNIHIEEIGIPEIFAKTLTFPTPVTLWNAAALRKLILNGPNVHPGATSIQTENGSVVLISESSESQRQALASSLLSIEKEGKEKSFKGIKTVYRHLQNGDYLLLNRQPSLHRPSIMGHRARVLYGDKVFRLHYANCKHYNADFDGDEMNAHFPQSHVARSEASHLVNASSHFLVPKDGSPLGGLIQDHIVAAVRLTMRGRFFSREDYFQLVFFALSSLTTPLITLPPTIIKPKLLWSGKQVVSTIILNLVPSGRTPPTLHSTAKIKADEWRVEAERDWSSSSKSLSTFLSDSTVIFSSGHLLSGILDKVHLGATPYGLLHCFNELYGSGPGSALLSAFSRLLTNFLQWEGFTLGVKDVLVLGAADEERRSVVEEGRGVGDEAARLGVGLRAGCNEGEIRKRLEGVHREGSGGTGRGRVDAAYKEILNGITNRINRSCLPHGLITVFPHNNLQFLVQSGAKGSTVNTMQISCLLGQIELEGKRPPLSISGKSLPSFTPYDTSPRAGGFISGRFLTGIRPQEFFFHCMAGREGLIDTAVKTSRSGYLQRCIVKLLEGLVTQYDGTVRDSDGTVIQYLYGEDGLDVCKSQFLKDKQIGFLIENSDSVLDKTTRSQIRKLQSSSELMDLQKQKIKEWEGSEWNKVSERRITPALKYFRDKKNSFKGHPSPNYEPKSSRSFKNSQLVSDWTKLSSSKKNKYEKEVTKCPDPVLSNFGPYTTFGSVSERLENLIHNSSFIQKEGSSKKDGKKLRDVVYYKSMQALSAPGDAVGVLAGQSIGEPSTQMTLNTFHFAGRGEMNVTLGIPRLREILMVASENIKTPSMDIPFHKGVSESDANYVKLKLTRVTLSQVLQEVQVVERIEDEFRYVILNFKFLSGDEYGSRFIPKPTGVLRYFERSFLPKKFLPALNRLLRTSRGVLETRETKESRSGRGGGGKKGGGNEEGGGEEEEDFGRREEEERGGESGEDHMSSDEEPEAEDADATQHMRRARHSERGYDEPEEDEILKEQSGDEGDEDEEGSKLVKDLQNDEELNEVEEEEVVIIKSKKKSKSDSVYSGRVNTVLAFDPFIEEYDYEREAEEECILTLKIPLRMTKVNLESMLKKEAKNAIIYQVPHISRAFISGSPLQGLKLKTEGINILAMASYRKYLDLNSLHCNNVHTMAKHYGIEAASKVIVKEITDVFKAYGISIDRRHLTLIADFMTSSGTYLPFNRHGIESSSSPLHQMSFETVVKFLTDAALGGRKDNLKNPSARLVVGKPAGVGTGIFTLLNPEKRQ